MPPPLPYFKVNIYPFSLPHFASIFFAYLWSFCWPNYIVTFPRYFSFRLPHLNIPSPSDELNRNSRRTRLDENCSHWNGYSHFRSGLNWIRKFIKSALKIKCQYSRQFKYTQHTAGFTENHWASHLLMSFLGRSFKLFKRDLYSFCWLQCYWLYNVQSNHKATDAILTRSVIVFSYLKRPSTTIN